jgi:hypothetical protein
MILLMGAEIRGEFLSHREIWTLLEISVAAASGDWYGVTVSGGMTH